MKNNRNLNLVLIAGMLFTLVAMGGCVPSETGGGGTSGFWFLVLMLALVFGTFYFLVIRPMRQRERRHDELVQELQKGDKVITAGGIYGEVERIDEDSVVLKVESGATIRVTKGGVVTRPKDITTESDRGIF